MGARNRHRRAEKLRRRQRASTAGSPSAQDLIHAAVAALSLPEPGPYRQLVVALAEGGVRVAAELDALVVEAVGTARSRRWADRHCS